MYQCQICVVGIVIFDLFQYHFVSHNKYTHITNTFKFSYIYKLTFWHILAKLTYSNLISINILNFQHIYQALDLYRKQKFWRSIKIISRKAWIITDWRDRYQLNHIQVTWPQFNKITTLFVYLSHQVASCHVLSTLKYPIVLLTRHWLNLLTNPRWSVYRSHGGMRNKYMTANTRWFSLCVLQQWHERYAQLLCALSMFNIIHMYISSTW